MMVLAAFGLGLRHSADADHLAAVSTLVAQAGLRENGIHSEETVIRGTSWANAQLGAWWGAGHLLTILACGGSIVLLRGHIPAGLDRALELGVAGMLLALGANTIRECFRGRYHFHRPENRGHVHAHLHFHPATDEQHEHNAQAVRVRQPLLIGAAHGLAGTAGITLLIAGTIESRLLGILYLLVFSIGAMAGMAVFGAAMGWPVEKAIGRTEWLNRMRLAAGAGSMAVGIILAA